MDNINYWFKNKISQSWILKNIKYLLIIIILGWQMSISRDSSSLS